jgi:S-adenosylmethionine/arginine decarboxylase-like enzyme
MKHLMLDGFKGFRSRFDDIRLIHEILSELPVKIGAEPIMPPFVLPYYDGILPEDVGISGIVLLRGGHFTIHTFSYAECYFADILLPQECSESEFRNLLDSVLPCSVVDSVAVVRDGLARESKIASRAKDFGPHYTLDLKGYQGPSSLGDVFDLLDQLPSLIGMTPIMRPLVLKDRLNDGSQVISGLTMIAESHLALHVFPERGEAAFDLFSCRFFDENKVIPKIKELLPAAEFHEHTAVRGIDFEKHRLKPSQAVENSRKWLYGLGKNQP